MVATLVPPTIEVEEEPKPEEESEEGIEEATDEKGHGTFKKTTQHTHSQPRRSGPYVYHNR